ncbi:hypothetical protein [Sphingorhabdus lutea]|uniref:hypothetical protein n=1 Tax=Sphingorhabdus lutea TaxID=1913578 RepID=UPI0018DD0489|nr:hypothetical protein [Sphingorhabdus lutea]
MKNIQIIDEAPNCAYDIFSIPDEKYDIIFPGPGQNIEFIENIIERLSDLESENLFTDFWVDPVVKSDVNGIDGILFYKLREQKAKFYPNKKDSDLDGWARGWISDPDAPPVNTPKFMRNLFK